MPRNHQNRMTSESDNDELNDSRYNSVEDLISAFVCVTRSVRNCFETSDDLKRALQGCGRDPSENLISKYWKKYHQEIGLELFLEIADEQEKIDEKKMINAFKLIDLDGDGYISYKEFMNLFTKENDALTPNEARKLLSEADKNHDNKLNYKEFSKLVCKTIDEAKKLSREEMKKMLSKRHADQEYLEKVIKNYRYNKTDPQFSNRQNRSIPPLKLNKNEFYDDRSELTLEQKRKNGSRLSFADEIDDYDGHFKRKENRNKVHENGLRNMLKNELKLSRSNESLQRENYDHSNRRNNSDSDNEKYDRKISIKNREKEGIRDKIRNRHEKDDKDSGRDKEIKKNKSNDSSFEIKFKPINSSSESFKEPKNFKKWITKSIKGGFYYNETMDKILSNSYALDLKSESSVFFSIEPYKTALHTYSDLMSIDMSLLIIKDSKNLSIKGLTENKIKTKWCTHLELTKGRYFLFPFTSGCHLKKRLFEPSIKNITSLFKDDLNNKRTLSNKFKEALSVMFDLCDLDSNGRLSQDELNFYTFLTSNEILSDEDWRFVGETVGLHKNELTKEGFIQLYKLEAKRDDTDIEDINTRLANMGFNRALTIDQSCSYKIEVSSELDNFDILLGEIYTTKSAEEFLKQLIESKLFNKGNAKIYKGIEDVSLIEYHNNYMSILEVLNQSPNDVIVDVNCTKSENCLSNVKDLNLSQKLKSNKSKILLYLTSNNSNKEWIVRCNFSISESSKYR